MGLFRQDVKVRNVLNKDGDIVLREIRNERTYFLGILMRERAYDRDTDHSDITLKSSKTLGFNQDN